jgi:hypothetical protein
LFVNYTLVLSGFATGYWARSSWGTYSDDDNDFGISESFWFSYITLTTVGLGDYHIPHEDFRIADMFYLPMVVLSGFIVLANFAVKLQEFLLFLFPSNPSLENLLQKQVEERAAKRLASQANNDS